MVQTNQSNQIRRCNQSIPIRPVHGKIGTPHQPCSERREVETYKTIQVPISYLFLVDDLLLFLEVTIDQIEVIMDCLDKFCDLSG